MPLSDGAGLARVGFSLAGGAHGEFRFALDPEWTLLTEDPEGYVPLNLRSGTIRIMPLGWIPLPGDANGDERVDDTDASILAAHWGLSGGATRADGDFNEDGEVNDADAAILAAHWQPGGSAVHPRARARHAGPAGFRRDGSASVLLRGGWPTPISVREMVGVASDNARRSSRCPGVRA